MNLMLLSEELLFTFFLLNSVHGSPVQFPEGNGKSIGFLQQKEAGSDEVEGRVFHGHGVKKKLKKQIKRRLLHCLLSAVNGRNANPQAQGRTLFVNFYDINISSSDGYGDNDEGDNDNYDDGNNNNNNNNGICSGSDSSSSSSGFGEGINHLGSFVNQNPIQHVTDIGSGVKPVYENPERFLNKYVWRPLYRSLRPLYYLF